MTVLEMLKNDPDNPNLYREAGEALLKEDRVDEAIALFSKGLILNPFDAAMRYRRGRKYIGRKDYGVAASDLKLAAMLDPENWRNWYYQGVACYLGGMFELARIAQERCLTLIKKHDPKSIPASVDWNWMILMRLGRRDEAQAVLDNVYPGMEAEDGDYLARTLLYKGYYSPDNFVEDRMKEIQNADRARSYELMLSYGLANWLHYQGKDEQAVPLLKKLAESPDNRNLFAVSQASQDLTALGVPFNDPTR